MGDMADWDREQYDHIQWYDEEVLDLDPPPKQHQAGCLGHKVTRVNKTTGEEFWGCSEFPRCRWSEGKEI